jgi:hypothetical protein
VGGEDREEKKSKEGKTKKEWKPISACHEGSQMSEEI